MSWSQRRAKKRTVKLVGGGTRYTTGRQKKDNGKGGSMKAARRLARKLENAKKGRSRKGGK